ncbi:PH domain-containing protein [Niallia sp. FSL W8-1348]|uniref:PH domain-containing protein n=1 Tax=Niallia sp. FSL W8-1348 TaxID=2954656 RepID=UPI0030FB7BC7
MIADLQTIEQQLKNNETIKGTIRCSLEVFIYRKIVRLGILAATEKRLIFCADSITGNELNESFEYVNMEDIQLKQGMLNQYIAIKYKKDTLKFKQITSENVEDFITKIKSYNSLRLDV